MKPYLWRTRNASYVYVDSMTGDDLGGDGTMANPYKTLGKAYRGRSAAPGTIVCRGRFCEDMADGNHSTTIRGDYMGAAVFDGEGAFLIYGFGHSNMIIENCAPATYDLVVHTGSGLPVSAVLTTRALWAMLTLPTGSRARLQSWAGRHCIWVA